MALTKLPITCISPVSGTTTGFDIAYNPELVTSASKLNQLDKPHDKDFKMLYMTNISFGAGSILFKFLTEGERDSWYSTMTGL